MTVRQMKGLWKKKKKKLRKHYGLSAFDNVNNRHAGVSARWRKWPRPAAWRDVPGNCTRELNRSIPRIFDRKQRSPTPAPIQWDITNSFALIHSP